ncbi:MAG: YeeE/YedE family protein [Thermoanaerobacter sp.]|nr:YeeE/YedE family protein [Thermoanaerobacter sp.]
MEAAKKIQNQNSSKIKQIFGSQWSFFWAGVAFGIAEIFYMSATLITNILKGKEAVLDPMTVTTDLGKMFRTVEVVTAKILHINDLQLYGKSIDGISASEGAFIPGIGWQIIGLMIGGLLVALFEKDYRSWVKYPPKLLLVNFLGGVLFSYGTRLAGGCTLNHLIGGIPLMSIQSTVTVIFMAIGGIAAFFIMGKLKLASYFKHQETLSYVKNNVDDPVESITYDPKYKYYKNLVWWLFLLFIGYFVIANIFGGIVNPSFLQHSSGEKILPFSKSIVDKGAIYVLLTLLAGIIGGFGLAKSGYGTECALISLETGKSMTKNDSFYAKLGIPRITRVLMRGYLPMIGIVTTWVIMLAFILIGWIFFGAHPGFEEGIKEQLTFGNVIGGFLLGMGAVLLIGCEIRTYMRIGLGYLGSWVGFLGFAVGYLPFTLFYEQHMNFLKATRVTETFKWYQLFFPNSEILQKATLFAWWLLLVYFLVYLIKQGAHNIGVDENKIVNTNTENLMGEIGVTVKKGETISVPVSRPAELTE